MATFLHFVQDISISVLREEEKKQHRLNSLNLHEDLKSEIKEM